MTGSIGYALGAGSGIDTKALIASLAEAQRAPKEAQIVRREEANAARISTLSGVAGAIDSFAAALSQLVSGGSLFTQPSVSDPSLLGASAIAGARLGDFSAQIEVVQLAQGQTLQSAPLGGRGDAVGHGRLTLANARGSFDIVIDGTNDSLDGLARAINDAKTGVTASVVTQAGSARLVLRGPTGEAEAFTLSVAEGAGSGIERFAYQPGGSGGMIQAQAPRDAVVMLDGIEVRRASNSFSDLIDGVQFDLKRAAPGTIIQMGVTRPVAALEQAVVDFVNAYNELQSMLAEATAPGVGGDGGPLRGDLAVREMQRQLGQLTSTVLASGGGPATLAEIGVRTNRDGTLGVNLVQLRDTLARDPEGVEALFNPSQHSSSPLVTIGSAIGRVKPGTYTVTDLVPASGGQGATGRIDGLTAISSGSSIIAPVGSPAVGLILRVGGAVGSATITIDAGLGGALKTLRDELRAATGPFASAQARFQKEAQAIEKDREALERRSETYYNQLVSQFTAMERQVSAFKATQSYLDQQIKMWTNSRD